jgi:transcriptional regulator with XRE-family HTH domain
VSIYRLERYFSRESIACGSDLWFVFDVARRTSQLIEILRAWCKEKWGRQVKVAKILGVGHSTVADWLSGRRQPTGEQALALYEFMRTVAAYQPPIEEPSKSDDPLSTLHAGLENPEKKNTWIRTIGQYHHVIIGGPNRDLALEQLKAFLRRGK